MADTNASAASETAAAGKRQKKKRKRKASARRSRTQATTRLLPNKRAGKKKKKRTAKKKATGKRRTAKKKATTRKRTAKTKRATTKKTASKKRRKRGPQADAWVHVSPQKILSFREQHGLSEAAAAKALGVSLGSLRNWTKAGRIASIKKQQLVKRNMAAYGPGSRPSTKRRAAPAKSGGRARSWSIVTPVEIEAYRQSEGLSKSALARKLSVSVGTVNNWLGNKGTVATTKAQQRVRELIGPRGAPAPVRPAPQAPAGGGSSTSVAILEVLRVSLERGAEIQPSELPDLIRDMREALGGE